MRVKNQPIIEARHLEKYPSFARLIVISCAFCLFFSPNISCASELIYVLEDSLNPHRVEKTKKECSRHYVSPEKYMLILKKLTEHVTIPELFVLFRGWSIKNSVDKQNHYLYLPLCISLPVSPTDDILAFIISRELAALERDFFNSDINQPHSFKYYKRLIPPSSMKCPKYQARLEKEKKDTRQILFNELDIKAPQAYLPMSDDDSQVYAESRALDLLISQKYDPCVVLNTNIPQTSKEILTSYLLNKKGLKCT